MGACDADDSFAECQCRICFDDCKPSEVISPCKCKGTLRYVHPGCLKKWQTSVLKMGNDERAYVCGVCRSRYMTSPPRPNPWRKVLSGIRPLTGALFASLLALSLSGQPSVHLAVLVLLLLATRSQALVCVLLLLAVAALGALYARGMRLAVLSDRSGHLGLALIRYGAPVDALSSGSLLVAAEGLDGSPFERSVVLVTEAGPRGAKGVVLTQPVEASDDLDRARASAPSGGPAAAAASGAIVHFVGGPVGAGRLRRAGGRLGAGAAAAAVLGGAGVRDEEVVVLHHVSGLPGASQLMGPLAPSAEASGAPAAPSARGGPQQPARAPPAAAAPQHGAVAPAGGHPGGWAGAVRGKVAAAAAAVAAAALLRRGSPPGLVGVPPGMLQQAREQQQQQASAAAAWAGVGLYQGGPIDQLLARIQQSGAPAEQQAQRAHGRARALFSRGGGSGAAAVGSKPAPQQVVRVFHGVCSWAAGQLEGELRGGMWGLVAAGAVADVAATPPQQLWAGLIDSDRVRWL